MMKAIVVGPLKKCTYNANNKRDRYPVKIPEHTEPDRVFNIRPYNMLLIGANLGNRVAKGIKTGETAKDASKRGRKRKRGELDDDEDDIDPRPKKKFMLTFSKILSNIYVTYSSFELARLCRHQMECPTCHVNYPVSWGKLKPKYFNWDKVIERGKEQPCMVCHVKKGSGLAYLLFARMCRIDTTYVNRQPEFLEQKLYWNIEKLCQEFEECWKKVFALNL